MIGICNSVLGVTIIKFPKILTIVLAAIFFIWSIVDPSVSGGSYYDDDYGMLIETGSFFGTMIIWWLIVCVKK